jgi:hypothetical protein
MPSQTIIDNPFVTLWFHPEKRIVHHQIHKFVAGAPFREMLLAGTELMKKRQAQKWLSDDRSNSALRKEDLDWSEVEWAPATAKAGWKYWAIVQPEKILAMVAMERLTEKYASLGVTAKIFTDPVSAMNWLEKQA